MDLTTRYLETFKTGDCTGRLAFLNVDVARNVTKRYNSRVVTKFVELCSRIRRRCTGELTDTVICSARTGCCAAKECVVQGTKPQADVGPSDDHRPSRCGPAGASTFCNLARWVQQVAP